MLVASVTTIRCSLSDAVEFVDHLRDTGIYRIYLYFDDPNDPVFEHFSDQPDIVACRCDDTHWHRINGGDRPPSVFERQACNATRVFQSLMESESGESWLLHLDVDERLFTSRPLTTVLSEAPAGCDAIRFSTAEAIPERLRPASVVRETSLFRRPVDAPLVVNADTRLRARLRRLMSAVLIATFRPRRYLAKKLGCGGAFRYGFHRGHSYGKCVTRVSRGVQRISVHKPKMRPSATGEPCLCHEGWLLHYDCCSVDVWQEKCRGRVESPPEPTMSRTRIEQIERFRAATDSEDPDAIDKAYMDIYFLTTYQKLVLRLMGFVVRLPDTAR